MHTPPYEIETARNGSLTLKIKTPSGWKYVYSKYRPEDSIKLPPISPETPCLLLGLGLGYELKALKKLTQAPILVVEKHQELIESFQSDPLACDPQISIFPIEELAHLNLASYQCLPTPLSELEASHYAPFFKKSRSKSPLKIGVYEHITIAHDVFEAFKEEGFSASYLPLKTKEALLLQAAASNLDALVTINFHEFIFEAAEMLHLPYIAWVVDTPLYDLYQKRLMKDHVYLFHYDPIEAEELKALGYPHVFHLPVAANIDRLEKAVSEGDLTPYACNISFLGSSGLDCEWNQLQLDTAFSPADFQVMTPEKVALLETASKTVIEGEEFLSKENKWEILVGRKLNSIERAALAKSLEKEFHLKLFGDATWKEICPRSYCGKAEHFFEMPKIFRASKINVNLTRNYVKGGLPMRVFDIMGSGGFMASNLTQDLTALFEEGKDFAAWRDLKDLKELATFFLAHEEKRQEIAQSGFEKIRDHHQFKHRVRKLAELSLKLLA